MLGVSIEMRTLNDTVQREGAALLNTQAQVPMCTGGAPQHSRVTFNRHYLGMAQAWLADARGPMAMAALRHRNRNQAAGVAFDGHQAQMLCEVPYNTAPWVSVVCDTRRAENAVHAVTERTAQTWDMAAGHIATLRDLFQPGYDYIKTIFDYITGHGQISAQAAQALQDHFRQRDFYLTRKGLAVFFPMAAPASHSEEVPTYVIPFSEFEGLRL